MYDFRLFALSSLVCVCVCGTPNSLQFIPDFNEPVNIYNSKSIVNAYLFL